MELKAGPDVCPGDGVKGFDNLGAGCKLFARLKIGL